MSHYTNQGTTNATEQKELEKVYNFMNAIEGYSGTLSSEIMDEYFNLSNPTDQNRNSSKN